MIKEEDEWSRERRFFCRKSPRLRFLIFDLDVKEIFTFFQVREYFCLCVCVCVFRYYYNE